MDGWSVADLLPGVWFTAVAVASWAVSRRWYDRLPLFELAAGFALVFALFGPALAGRGVLLPLDTLRGYVPFTDRAPPPVHGNYLQNDLLVMIAPSQARSREALATGEWPLWNDRVGAGMPLLADPQAQPFQPLAVVAMPLGVARGAVVTAALKVWFAFLFLALLLRRQGLLGGPALLGGIAYGGGGFVVLWVGWPLATTAALLPGVLYALVRCRRVGRRRDLILLAALLASLLLAGHPETVLYALVVAAAFAVALGREQAPSSGGSYWRQVGSAAVLALLVTAPVLLSTRSYLPQTVRAAQLASGDHDGAAVPDREWAWPRRAVARLVPVVAPNAFGNSRFLHYWGPGNSNEDAAGFVGTVTVALALLALVAARRLPQEGLVVGLLVVATVVLTDPPGVERLLGAISTSVRSPSGHHRLLLVVAFALAYLASCAAQRLAEGRGRWWGSLIVAGLAAGLVGWAYLALRAPGDPQLLDPLRWGSAVWAWRSLALLAFLGVLAHRRLWAAGALAFAVMIELVVVHGPANPAMPERLAWPPPPAVEWLQAQAGRERVIGGARVVPANVLSLYGLADARLHNPMAPAAYPRSLTPGLGEAEMVGSVRGEWLDRLAVRYVLDDAEAEPLDPVMWRSSSAVVSRRPGARTLVTVDAQPVEITVQTPSRIEVRAAARESDRLLEAAVYQDGGWRVVAGGRPVETIPTLELPLVAAWLPAAAAEAKLLYRPPGFLPGCLLAALGLTGLFALGVPPPRGG